MKYRESFIQTHDIDFVFKVNKTIVHAASCGYPLPRLVNDVNRNRENIMMILNSDNDVPDDKIWINRDYIERIVKSQYDNEIDTLEQNITEYYESFFYFAKKGLWSYDVDMSVWDLDENQSYNTICYHLICRPSDDNFKLRINNDCFPRYSISLEDTISLEV